MIHNNSVKGRPSVMLSSLPIAFLLFSIICVMMVYGADQVSEVSPLALLGASLIGLVLSFTSGTFSRFNFLKGMLRSVGQTLPAIPLLVFIATVSATWMLSGVVPVLISYGLEVLNPDYFLIIACVVCSFISILTGSSWTTIATIGVAFMGIGTVMGYSPGWIAGAIISGAYFGDKMSPLSDTTVLASSSGGVDLFDHIRYMVLTSGPAMLVSLAVFAIAGFCAATNEGGNAGEIVSGLGRVFNLNNWVLVIPLVTGVLIALRVPTLLTLALSSLMGLTGVFVFQPQIVDVLLGGGAAIADYFRMIWHLLWSETSLTTGEAMLDSLISTGGITGMLPTIFLVVCAMMFGGVMMGTGMLGSLADAFTRKIGSRSSLVGTTAASGILLNACTADQYLSIIVGSNMFKPVYQKFGLQPRLLSRTVEDSTSVTSVLIPWNSCGVTQSTVLGVATLTYLPFCVFNYLSPLMSMLMAWTGWRIKHVSPVVVSMHEARAEAVN